MSTTLALRSRAPALAFQAIGLSLVIAISARIVVPFWPVPMTLQPLAVMAIASTFGARVGVAAMLTYLAEGMLGAPVFAGGNAGPAVLLGPTGGYLIGMLAMSAIVGSARGPWQRAGALVAGIAVDYLFGAAWLSTFVGIPRAIEAGVLPFIAGDAVKGAIAWVLGALVAKPKA